MNWRTVMYLYCTTVELYNLNFLMKNPVNCKLTCFPSGDPLADRSAGWRAGPEDWSAGPGHSHHRQGLVQVSNISKGQQSVQQHWYRSANCLATLVQVSKLYSNIGTGQQTVQQHRYKSAILVKVSNIGTGQQYWYRSEILVQFNYIGTGQQYWYRSAILVQVSKLLRYRYQSVTSTMVQVNNISIGQ